MVPEGGKVQALLEDSEARSDGWFARGVLPLELQESTASRLGIIGILTAGTFMIFALLAILPEIAHRNTPGVVRGVSLGCTAFAVTFSLALFALCRWRADHASFVLKLGVAYQIVMAMFIGVLDNLAFLEPVGRARGWSGVAVWIFIFAVFVPNTPLRTLWVSSIIALIDFSTLLVIAALGDSPPDPISLPLIFAPTVVALLTAVISARINCRMSRRLHRAQELGSYRLVELLGKGGMGEVWRAEHKMLVRPAAVKMIRASSRDGTPSETEQSQLRRFEREAQATALLESEHTIKLYDFGISTEGSFYYVMELLEGLDLEELVKRHGPMPPSRAVHCLLQVCESLAEAHDNQLIHRDIKPSNIYLCKQALKYDRIKVLDFGLVKSSPGKLDHISQMTAEKGIGGTPAYMVPEIIKGVGEIDGRADLYALGCVAYWLLSGELVFDHSSVMMMVADHVNKDPAPLSRRSPQPIPSGLERVVHGCLEKDPQARPQSAQELGALLAQLKLAEAWTHQDAREWWTTAFADQEAPGGAAGPLSATVEDFMDATTLSPLERTEVDKVR